MTRTESIKEYIWSYPPEICLERAMVYTEEFFKTPAVPIVIRRANCLKRFLEEMTLYIGKNDLLVGNTASKPLAASIFPEFSIDWIEEELESFENRPRQKFVLTPDNKKKLAEICRTWNGSTHSDRVNYNLKTLLGSYLMAPGKDGKGHQHPNVNQVMSIEHNQNGDGHIIPDYESILDVGLEAIYNKAKTQERILAECDKDYMEKKVFLQAVQIILQGARCYILRCAKMAKKQIALEGNPVRQTELKKIADNCEHIAKEAPATFEQALQLTLFIHLLLQIESNGHSMSLGRMDSYLYRFYEEDCKKGVMNEERAQQLFECFLLKCFEANKIRDWATTEILGGNQLFQTITLGGQSDSGKTAVNALSYIFLKALGNTNMAIPTVIVSVGKTTPISFYEAGVKALIEHGGGMPAFFNDDIAVEMMLRDGIDLKDARRWAGMGCSEVRVPGKHNTGVTPVYVNILKLFELAMHDGKNPATGELLCPPVRGFTECKNIRDVEALYIEQIDYYLEFIPKIERAIAESYRALTPTPLLSSVINHRIEMATDVSCGGGANYNNTIVHFHGFPNVANIFAALDRVVFRSKRYTLEEIKEAVCQNFESEKGKEIRQQLLDSPKMGNDNSQVDQWCAELYQIFSEKMEKYRPSRGGKFGCTAQTVVMNVIDGEVVGATPDGRLAQEALADNLSPVPGTDLSGLTAVFNSLSKIDHASMDNGDILNIRFHPSALNTEEKRKKVAQAIWVYFHEGGFQVQFNVIGRETLIAAQKHPEKYRSLVVKVAGFSSFYVELEEKWQNHLIARTEYEK